MVHNFVNECVPIKKRKYRLERAQWKIFFRKHLPENPKATGTSGNIVQKALLTPKITQKGGLGVIAGLTAHCKRAVEARFLSLNVGERRNIFCVCTAEIALEGSGNKIRTPKVTV